MARQAVPTEKSVLSESVVFAKSRRVGFPSLLVPRGRPPNQQLVIVARNPICYNARPCSTFSSWGSECSSASSLAVGILSSRTLCSAAARRSNGGQTPDGDFEVINRRQERLCSVYTACQSCRTTLSRDSFTWSSPSYLMNPNFLSLFINKLTCDRVLPIISAGVC